MNRAKRYSPEVRERAVRMVLEQQQEHDYIVKLYKQIPRIDQLKFRPSTYFKWKLLKFSTDAHLLTNFNPGRGTGATLKGEHALYIFYPNLLGLRVGD